MFRLLIFTLYLSPLHAVLNHGSNKKTMEISTSVLLNEGTESHLSKKVPISYPSLTSRAKDGEFIKVRQLLTKLLKSYNKEVVLDKPIIIHMDVLLLQVKNTIEKEGILETVVALMIEWKDARMQWDPAEYSNLTFLSLTTDQVWLPDIAMTNSADHLYSISRDSRFTVRVSYDGVFKFVPTGTAKTWCGLKLITFPFDIQQCSIEFESWSLDSNTMTFDGYSDLLVDSSFASMQFQLCNHHAITFSHTYNFTGETFTRVRFLFTVKRKSTFYVINLIFPIMVLSLIQTLGFLIPCCNTTADRIAFGTTNLLTLVVYQTILTEQMPKTSDAVTALSKYVIVLIVTSAIGILESVIVQRIHNRTVRPPPYFLMRLLKCVPVLMREAPIEAERHRRMTMAAKPDQLQMNPTLISRGSIALPEPKRNLGRVSSLSCAAKQLRHFRKNCSPSLSNRFHNQDDFFQTNKSLSDLYLFDETEEIGLNSTSNVPVSSPPRKRLDSLIVNRYRRQRSLSSSSQQLHHQLQHISKSRIKLMVSRDREKKKFHREMLMGRMKHYFKRDYYKEWLATEPRDLWAELAFKLDCLTFILCCFSALSAPVMMFLPLVVVTTNDPCANSDDVH